MSADFICDGCGKREPGYWNGQYFSKPDKWYLRSDEDGPQVACSRTCIDVIAEATGKTSGVLPV